MRLALVGTFMGCALVALPASAQDRFDVLIERLEHQEREIQELRKEVQALRQVVPPPPQHPEYFREDGEEPLTEYVNPAIRLDVAGQVNPAMNVAGDGDKTKVYFVDNDTTASRIRFAGVGVFDRGPQLGTTLEVGFSPNNSSDVSQDNEIAGSSISVRRAEVWVRDDRYGRVMFGQGSTAADNTAEYDLSLVSGPIMTSGVSFIAGGLQFTDGNELSGVTIADAFQNFDGNRDPRIRYDSPMLGPLQLSASAGANQTYGAALTWGGDYDHWTAKELDGITTLGAVSIYNPNEGGVDFRVAGSVVDAARRERTQRDGLLRLRQHLWQHALQRLREAWLGHAPVRHGRHGLRRRLHVEREHRRGRRRGSVRRPRHRAGHQRIRRPALLAVPLVHARPRRGPELRRHLPRHHRLAGALLMRAPLHAAVLALALFGCAGSTPEPVEKPESYNRRELPPSPGLFTGPDGTWTLYRNERAAPAPAPEATAPEPAPAAPKRREILMCGRGQKDCEQPEESGERD